MGEADARARQRRLAADCFDHVEKLARGIVLGRVQVKIMAALGEKFYRPAQAARSRGVDRKIFRLRSHVAITGAPRQNLAEAGEAKQVALIELLDFFDAAAEL